jgi:4-amino-4-deoxychorismate lyase
MSLLLESIKITGGIPQNLDLHNARLNNSRRQLFGSTNLIDLRDVLHTPPDLTEMVYKCRVLYDETIQKIEYLPYTPRTIKSLRLILGDDIEYAHKYVDRSQIDRLRNESSSDDILIIKRNRITDSSQANVVFFDGTSWITPAEPLLRGTRRQALLDSGRIREEDITVHDLQHFKKAALINAMIDLEEGTYIEMGKITK